MKNEELFSKNGFYKFVVQTNMMFHNETKQLGISILKKWINKQPINHPIRVLDLACGGLPICITNIISYFDQYEFEYTGIDINPDQIKLAESYNFPKNIIKINLKEDNAWDLLPQLQNESFDIIFSGMNFHHGTPEELYFVANQLKQILNSDGLILSHDLYRPNQYTYLRRPNTNPNNPSESYEMISKEKLLPIPNLNIKETENDWRKELLQSLLNYLKEHNATRSDLDQEYDHVFARDYPVSTNEISNIFKEHGFKSKTHTYDSNRILKKYFNLIEFWNQ